MPSAPVCGGAAGAACPPALTSMWRATTSRCWWTSGPRWCDCRQMAPAFAQAARGLEPGVRLAKLNTEEPTGHRGALCHPAAFRTMILFRQGRLGGTYFRRAGGGGHRALGADGSGLRADTGVPAAACSGKVQTRRRLHCSGFPRMLSGLLLAWYFFKCNYLVALKPMRTLPPCPPPPLHAYPPYLRACPCGRLAGRLRWGRCGRLAPDAQAFDAGACTTQRPTAMAAQWDWPWWRGTRSTGSDQRRPPTPPSTTAGLSGPVCGHDQRRGLHFSRQAGCGQYGVRLTADFGRDESRSAVLRGLGTWMPGRRSVRLQPATHGTHFRTSSLRYGAGQGARWPAAGPGGGPQRAGGTCLAPGCGRGSHLGQRGLYR